MTNFPDDLDDFLCEEFAEQASVNGQTVTVIFDREYLEQDAGGQVFGSRVPVLTGKTADFENAAEGDPVTVRNTDFRIKTIEPDNTGMCLVELRRG